MRAFFAVLILAAAFVAGCGSDDADDGAAAGPTGSDSACNLDYVNKQIEAHKGIADWSYPGEPFDASKASGKTIFSIQENSTNPFTNTIVAGMQEVAKKVGIKVIDYPNQGQRTQWIQGIQQAISRKVDAIVLSGGTIGPIYFKEQAAAAERAGIPIITVVDRDLTQEAEPHTAARVGQPYVEAARLDVDWINSEAAKEEFAKHCGSGCTTKFVNVPLSQWATKIPTTVQTEVSSNPNLNYVFPLYDAMSQFVVPAIQVGGGINRVKVASFNGTPGILKMIQSADVVEMIVGENETLLGYSAMDQAMRLMTDVEPIGDGDYGIPLRIFDDTNVDETGTPPEYGVGYGDAWRNGFLQAWGLSN
jgi:ribose transport system substrate-binding protein